MTPEPCYICKKPEPVRFPSNSALCLSCGQFNDSRRGQTADLRGYTCIVTGGRIKVGFEVAIKLLRAGASVIVTSRFVAGARAAFASLPDSASWAGRLSFYACDFRELGAVVALVEAIKKEHATVDVLVNNAAQTIHRPPAFYRELLSDTLVDRNLGELGAVAAQRLVLSGAIVPGAGLGLDPDRVAKLSILPVLPQDELEGAEFFPEGARDGHGQPQDRRSFNSWMMGLTDVPLLELLEVLYINAIAPFILCTGLHAAMTKKPGERPSFIVNVTAMEGNFHDPEKNHRHPHTNMAKAALNMMTRTTAIQLQADRIFMNAVDPGWITNERPHPLRAPAGSHPDRMPLDEVDGAARVCDPIFRSLVTGEPVAGRLFKNFEPYPW